MGSSPERGHAARIAQALETSMPARSVVAASWQRSLTRYGLDPLESRPPRTLTGQELREAREGLEPLLHSAQAPLDRLFQAVGDAGCCVLFSDRNGVPLDRRGAATDDSTFYRWGLWTGAVWSEEAEGTNGIGTCLAEGRALTIHRDQHFHARNTGLSCTVAPVYDHTGQLAACLDVSSCRADLTEGYVGLIATAVADAARQIEALNFRKAFPQARIVLVDGASAGGAGLLALDHDDLVIGATRAARLAFGITDARIAALLPAQEVLKDDAEHDLIDAERSAVRRALARAKGNVSEAAAALHISRATLHRKMKRLGLQRGR
ncbi:GAF domain-containing protein [Microvirga terricola]|uniref:Sigma-54-dependent Fis family transcriptional regulator n=1 Tax=Microvirga terricola TaxID=2719797 RepID=A0ABX0VBE9_9HYPH|nr:GAF domain-containing protein [Microvirga terricola]NIX77023.1 sigma-54-dependent Fis family transcriptional regulator [Microvirga terricola]